MSAGKLLTHARRHELHLTLLVLTVVATAACGSSEQRPTDAQSATGNVVCNRFEAVAKRTGDTLTLSLDTDLPDFQEKSSVGKWREPRSIVVADNVFNAALQERMKITALAGTGGELDRIASEIEIDMTVPVNQSNLAAFGENNQKLRGTAVGTQGSFRLVRAEVRLPYPMSGKIKADAQWGNPNALAVGKSYRVSRDTPLMPELNPSDPLRAIALVRQIPPDGSIAIRQVATKDHSVWYQVDARNASGAHVGSGWVNSAALLGQELKVVGTKTHGRVQ
jgi:hypothetical protein